MLQTWIMRADELPVEAVTHSDDSSVCGTCPRRHALGGDCYVLVGNGPQAAWKAWNRNGRPFENWTQHIDTLKPVAQQHGLRFGSYGDPAAVPHTVWQGLLDELQPRLHTGYTHQWNNPSLSMPHKAWLRHNVMASADSEADLKAALQDSWRYFAALPSTATVPKGAVLCSATRATNQLTCETCGICNGTQGKASRASVYLSEHGVRSAAKHRRSEKLRVIQ